MWTGARDPCAHPRKKVHIVATGVYAQLIARELPEIDAVNPHLTLGGLRIVANLNCTHFSEVG
jgi:pantothenate kinase type III